MMAVIILIGVILIIGLSVIYFVSEKIGYAVNIAFVVVAGIFNYITYGFAFTDIYLFGPLTGFYGETESGVSIIACILPPIIIVVLSYLLFLFFDKIRGQIHINRAGREYEEYLKAKEEKIRAEFMAITDYDEYHIRRNEFHTLNMDENLSNHLSEIFDNDKLEDTSDNKATNEIEDGVIEEIFEMTIGDIDVQCAGEIAINHLDKVREENNIYGNEKKMIEYKKLVDQYVKKIKKIRSTGSDEMITIWDAEKYKAERMWRVELRMKYMQVD